MLIGFGDDYRLSHHAVFAPNHIVRETPGVCLSPMRVAPFSLATLLALASTESESTSVSMLKVLVTMFFLPSSRGRSNDKTVGLHYWLPAVHEHLLERHDHYAPGDD